MPQQTGLFRFDIYLAPIVWSRPLQTFTIIFHYHKKERLDFDCKTPHPMGTNSAMVYTQNNLFVLAVHPHYKNTGLI